MIIVKLMGGLGNQMFQYAAGRALSLHHQCILKIDLNFLLDRRPREQGFVYRDYDLGIFNIDPAIANEQEIKKLIGEPGRKKTDKIIAALLGRKHNFFKEPSFNFYPNFFQLVMPVYLEGYWQSEKYFQRYEQQIRKDFTFRYIPSQAIQLMAEKIQRTRSVCVNVRRGDFVTNPLHGTASIEYYRHAAKNIESRIASPEYFVFSDDIEWCKVNLSFSAPVHFISHEYAGNKFSDYLYLMTCCSHFIIPNSSFAWWAAWLNNNPDKIIIAPKKWFNKGPKDTQDLIPESWITL